MKNFLVLSLALLLCLAVLPVSAQIGAAKQVRGSAPDTRAAVGGLLLSPLLQRVQANPGEKSELTFTLENPTQTTDTALAELRSFLPEDNTYRARYDEAHPRDATGWFETKRLAPIIGAGQRLNLRLPYRIPRDAKGAYWTMLRLIPKPNGSQTKSLVEYEVPIVIIVGKNPKPEVQVLTPVLQPMTRGAKPAMRAILPIESLGEGFTVIGAMGTVRSLPSQRVVANLRVDDRNLMPKSKRELAFLIPSLPAGQYRVDFRLQTGPKWMPPIGAEFQVDGRVVRALTPGQRMAVAAVTLEPSSLNLLIPQGGKRTVTLRITNNHRRDIVPQVVPREVIQSENGAIGVGAKGPSVGVQVDGEGLSLAPGQSRVYRLVLSVNRESRGDQWFAIAVSDQSDPGSLPETLLGTVSVPKSQVPSLKVVNPKLVTDKSKVIAIRYEVQNAGNVAIRPEAIASVLADGVRLEDRLAVPQLGDGGILPGSVLKNVVMLPPVLKPGLHVVEISYQYGMNDFAKLRVPITIPTRVQTKTETRTQKTAIGRTK